MAQEYRAKVFKSGNSVALRLPKALGIPEGAEMVVREEHGRYVLEPSERPRRKFNIAKVWGSATGLKLLLPEDRIFEPRRLLWDDFDRDEAAE